MAYDLHVVHIRKVFMRISISRISTLQKFVSIGRESFVL